MLSMKKLLVIFPLLGLVFTACDKKNTAEPALVQKTEAAVRDAADKTKKAVVDAADKTKDAIVNAADKTKEAVLNAADRTKEAAIDAKDAIHDKLVEWRLTPSDIKADFANGGRVVRSKAAAARAKTGEVFDHARIVTVINGKFVADSQVSAFKIKVDADQGVVTLKGTVKSVELIGRAIGIALDTDGVARVVSLLTVEPP